MLKKGIALCALIAPWYVLGMGINNQTVEKERFDTIVFYRTNCSNCGKIKKQCKCPKDIEKKEEGFKNLIFINERQQFEHKKTTTINNFIETIEINSDNEKDIIEICSSDSDKEIKKKKGKNKKKITLNKNKKTINRKIDRAIKKKNKTKNPLFNLVKNSSIVKAVTETINRELKNNTQKNPLPFQKPKFAKFPLNNDNNIIMACEQDKKIFFCPKCCNFNGDMKNLEEHLWKRHKEKLSDEMKKNMR